MPRIIEGALSPTDTGYNGYPSKEVVVLPSELVQGRGWHDDLASVFQILPLVSGQHRDRVASILGPERPRDVVEEVEAEHFSKVR